MQSSIFFRNFTCMDHAFIDEDGMVHGMSFNLSATLSGLVDSAESVVVDFSRGKKLLKSYVDDCADGFDHKLLLYPFSNYCITDLKDDRVYIWTKHFSTTCPKDAIRFITKEHELCEYLTGRFNDEFPGANITVKTKAADYGFTEFGHYFNYSHGLKDSTSWGCQNQNHGHQSFVEVLKADGSGNHFLQKRIAEYLDETIFINKANVVSKSEDEITIKYTSADRGEFESTYRKPHKWIILETETTIEYIIEFVRDFFYEELKGHTLRVSEGLMKGAEINVE
jgi:6-pyruvoyl-tetrahydropterin synthase